MAKKEFSYRGKTLNELQQMSMEEFAVLVPARERRRLKRGFTDEQKTLLRNLQRANEVKTHCREMVVIPQMVGKMIKVYNGKEFTMVQIVPEMLAHRLGDQKHAVQVDSHDLAPLAKAVILERGKEGIQVI